METYYLIHFTWCRRISWDAVNADIAQLVSQLVASQSFLVNLRRYCCCCWLLLLLLLLLVVVLLLSLLLLPLFLLLFLRWS